MNDLIWVAFLLFTKHFVVDFPLQGEYQWRNKGTYGHPGGILHASIHGIYTFICIYWYAPESALLCSVIDIFVHYHIDWVKVTLNDMFEWKADTHKEFWILLGFDQYLHALTYIAFLGLIS